MYEKQTKEKFTKDMEHRIKVRKQVEVFVSKCLLELLEKYNKKRFTQRVIDGLKCNIPNDWFVLKEDNCLTIKAMYFNFNYIDVATVSFEMPFDEHGRLIVDELFAYKSNQHWFDMFKRDTKLMQEAIDNYDKWLSAAKELQHNIEEYANTTNLYFRDNVRGFSTFYIG